MYLKLILHLIYSIFLVLLGLIALMFQETLISIALILAGIIYLLVVDLSLSRNLKNKLNEKKK